jgi:signal transduction histidine kinase
VCACSNIPRKLDNDIALTFFRVVQESLHNIAKHSGASNVHVEVAAASGELTLIVRDNGAGFDVQESRAATGLGLVSMRERLHLIGGEFDIDSAPGTGTPCMGSNSPDRRQPSSCQALTDLLIRCDQPNREIILIGFGMEA